ncbi:MAG TPA: MlaD family protein [Candidatus Dormibacteraeota bacterium]|jgi:virulence factor Mce-like protein|nr:MlaD family protein [Candidatus Dormibacteraeota bacterium]
MNRKSLATLIALAVFAAVCIGGLGYLAVGMGLQVPGIDRGTVIEADFAQANGVVDQSSVYVSGVQVGTVIGISSDHHRGALVTMRIDPGIRLRTDVKAYVQPKSLIGEQYVDLVRSPGSTAPYLSAGHRIPRSRTGQSVQINAILNTLDPQTRAAMTQTLRQLGVAVQGQAGDINESIPQVEQATANLRPIVQVTDQEQVYLNEILQDVAVIMQALADEQQALGQVVNSGDTAVGAIAQRDQQLAGTIQQANTLMISLSTIFQDLTPSDRTSLERAPGTIQTGQELLAELNPTIDELLPELLLAQVNYPNNQLDVSAPQAETLASEWLSAFSQNDDLGHSFRITPVIDPSTQVQLPISLPALLDGGSSGGGSSGSSSPSSSSTPPSTGQNPTEDASGGLIPSVVQLLLGQLG